MKTIEMSLNNLVEFLQTTVFSDETFMTVRVWDVGNLDNDGVIHNFQYYATVQLSYGDDKSKDVLYKIVKARDKTPFLFQTLNMIFSDILWNRDSTLHMMGHRDFDSIQSYLNHLNSVSNSVSDASVLDMQTIADAAYDKGYVMGKYTQDIQLTNDVLLLLENSNKLMSIFRLEFNNGFVAGLADTQRD